MKKVISFSVFSLFLVLVSYSQTDVVLTENERIIWNYNVLEESSYIQWKASKVGGSHEGMLKFSNGKIVLEDSLLNSIDFSIDMNSISCSDIENEEKNQQLVDHLKSSDFFNVENNPSATFISTSVIHYGKASDEGPVDYKIIGDLTINGKTQTVKVKASLYMHDGPSMSALARLEIDRTDFDIRYGSGSFFDNLGDKLIHDEVNLYVSLSATR